MKPPHSRLVPAAIVLAVASLLPAAAGPDVCYHARIAGPIVLPDGSEHPSGDLELCPMRKLSPVSTLERIAIDGRPIGMFVGHRTASERDERGGPPTFVFVRDERRRLALVARTAPGGNGRLIYWLEPPGGERRPRSGADGPGLLAATGWDAFDVVAATSR